jgi:hypothetical protein
VTRTVMSSILLFAHCSLCISAQAEGLTAEATQVKVERMKTEDAEVSVYRISFVLRVTNAGVTNVSISLAPAFITGIQLRDKDGSWSWLNQSSWYDDGSVRYDPCSPLPPREVAYSTVLNTQLLTSNNKIRLSGAKQSMIRFQLETLCRNPDGKALTTHVLRTEPLLLALPEAAR